MCKSWEGYGKNWMHFVYKMDHLFRSIRVSDKNSYVTKGFHFFELIWTPDFLCVQNEPFKATSSIFNLSWLHLLFFMHLMIYFELNDPEIEKHYKWTLKRLKLGMVSSFTPHSMCTKVERVTAKTGCTSCTNWTISFEYQGFRRKLIYYKGISFSITYFNSRIFVRSVCTIQRHIINFQPFSDFICYFHAFNDLFFKLNDPEIEKHYKWTLKRLKLGMVSSFHPHSMC